MMAILPAAKKTKFPEKMREKSAPVVEIHPHDFTKSQDYIVQQ